jgi:protein tyrosine/serine phosphatase
MPAKISMNLAIIILVLGGARFSSAGAYANSPTERFGKVHEGLYRGAAPKSLQQYKELKKLGIKTILNLQEGEDKIAAGKINAEAAGLQFLSIPLDGFWAPKDWQADAVLAALNNPDLKPIYIHCTHGRERTGIMVALHRVESDGWTAKKAYAEAKAYGFRWVVFPMKDYFEKRTHTDL